MSPSFDSPAFLCSIIKEPAHITYYRRGYLRCLEFSLKPPAECHNMQRAICRRLQMTVPFAVAYKR